MKETPNLPRNKVFPFIGNVNNTLLSEAKYNSFVVLPNTPIKENITNILMIIEGTDIGTLDNKENIPNKLHR